MIGDKQEAERTPAGVAQSSSVLQHVAGGVCLAFTVAAAAVFVGFFDTTKNQLLVDSLWLLALVLWVLAVKLLRGGPLLGIRPSTEDVLPIAGVLVLFAAAWLPFYDNWRWAFTGDSLSIFGTGYYLFKNGPHQNILSVHGIEDTLTYFWEISYSVWVYVFGPTFFGHRFGSFVMSCLALTAIYTYFTLVMGRAWALLIVVATASNYVWLWFSYVSYLKIDSFIFYFMALTFATLIWRQPERLGAWIGCGFTAGLSMFFTPTAWSGVIFAGLFIAAFALVTRRVVGLTVTGVSFLLAAVPMLFEIRWLLRSAGSQSSPVLEWDYLKRIFHTILMSPYDSPIDRLGVQGAFLRWPLGTLYLVGLGLAVLAVLPPLRRWLRLPAIVPVLLVLLLWDAALLSLTNKGYGLPSHKRSYNLIPLQIFFAVVPMYFVYTWGSGWSWLRRLVVVVIVAAVGTYAVNNVWCMMYPPPFTYGNNIYDGLIELRQRFADRKVLLLTSRQGILPTLAPDELLNIAYKVLDQLTIDTTFAEDVVLHACAQHTLVCYEPNPDQPYMQPLFDKYPSMLARFPLLNSNELVCYECVGTGGAPVS